MCRKIYLYFNSNNKNNLSSVNYGQSPQRTCPSLVFPLNLNYKDILGDISLISLNIVGFDQVFCFGTFIICTSILTILIWDSVLEEKLEPDVRARVIGIKT